MLFYDFECNLATQQSLAWLETTFNNEVPGKATIYNWLAEFKRGRVNLSDKFRDGRPSSAMNNKNIDAVRHMIETDRHVTYHNIQACLGQVTSFVEPITAGEKTFSSDDHELDVVGSRLYVYFCEVISNVFITRIGRSHARRDDTGTIFISVLAKLLRMYGWIVRCPRHYIQNPVPSVVEEIPGARPGDPHRDAADELAKVMLKRVARSGTKPKRISVISPLDRQAALIHNSSNNDFRIRLVDVADEAYRAEIRQAYLTRKRAGKPPESSHRCPWTLAILEESLCVALLLEGNKTFNGGESS
ncbi:hypothetical protein EVAR_89705_1 [Eumeta japonica]|uniref:Mos1 transposase HTH domain-containing protein n=1 Tax=Eumeta variegata TaxID=151549 RepID=A0A4C1X0J1_EUMVA|nr:hypothetical protein EVAR_89705_1 [Eumeta japonica]